MATQLTWGDNVLKSVFLKGWPTTSGREPPKIFDMAVTLALEIDCRVISRPKTSAISLTSRSFQQWLGINDYFLNDYSGHYFMEYLTILMTN